MNQPTWLQHIHRSPFRPSFQLVPVDALVGGCIGYGNPIMRTPLECDKADVAMAHGALTQEIYTMF